MAKSGAAPRYNSTRGGVKGASFEEVVLGGLAPDKGLYVPEFVPTFSPAELERLRPMSFPDLAFEIMRKFIDPSEISSENLRRLVDASYGPSSRFRVPEVAPTVQVGAVWVMELFHGPTFAFKDVALQFLGNLFEFFLERRRAGGDDARLAILGATSGDTGSAAISGLRGKRGVDCFMLYPDGRVSAIQEQQMATVPDANIHCIAIAGTFDDAQAIVKKAFVDREFNAEVSLGAVNSINWARVLAQVTYYFKSYFEVSAQRGADAPLAFSVPTGNFGDILAGYYAKRMGLPVKDLLVATNENDILHRFFTRGEYHKTANLETLAPSMDICVSSNFERYLYHLCGDDSATLKGWMTDFESTGKLTVQGERLEQAREVFKSASVVKAEVLETIKLVHNADEYLLCPHSAIGFAAIGKAKLPPSTTVCLATAHAAKFPTAVSQAVGALPGPPEELAALARLPLRRAMLPNSLEAVQGFMRARLAGRSSRSWARENTTIMVACFSVAVGILMFARK